MIKDEPLERCTKKELIEEVYKARRLLVQEMINNKEKIELLHLDLANQIHWRLKLEEELKSGKQ